jgi:hypothetical protein
MNRLSRKLNSSLLEVLIDKKRNYKKAPKVVLKP